MKTYHSLILASLFCLCGVLSLSAQSRSEKKARTEQAVRQSLEKKAYTIDVNYMNPRRGPGRALTDSYTLTVRNDSLLSYLPYVGEAYAVPYGGGKALNFDAPSTQYTAEADKKGRHSGGPFPRLIVPAYRCKPQPRIPHNPRSEPRTTPPMPQKASAFWGPRDRSRPGRQSPPGPRVRFADRLTPLLQRPGPWPGTAHWPWVSM